MSCSHIRVHYTSTGNESVILWRNAICIIRVDFIFSIISEIDVKSAPSTAIVWYAFLSTILYSTVRLLFFSQFGICTEYNSSMSTVGLFSLSRPIESPHPTPPPQTARPSSYKPTITHWYGWTIFVIYYWLVSIDFSKRVNISMMC